MDDSDNDDVIAAPRHKRRLVIDDDDDSVSHDVQPQSDVGVVEREERVMRASESSHSDDDLIRNVGSNDKRDVDHKKSGGEDSKSDSEDNTSGDDQRSDIEDAFPNNSQNDDGNDGLDLNPSTALSTDRELNCVRDKRGRVVSRGKSRTPRASALASIQATSSRLLRESRVQLPSHKPPTLTLQQFLARKKNNEGKKEQGKRDNSDHDREQLEEPEKNCDVEKEKFNEKDEDEVAELNFSEADGKETQSSSVLEKEETLICNAKEAVAHDNLELMEVVSQNNKEIESVGSHTKVNSVGESFVERRPASKSLSRLVISDKLDSQPTEKIESAASSLHLVLEPDSVEFTTDSSDFIGSSQKSARFKYLSKFDLPGAVALKPRLATQNEILEPSDTLLLEEGPERLIQRALKHTKKRCVKKKAEEGPIVVYEDEDKNGEGSELGRSAKKSEVDKMLQKVRSECPGTKHSVLKQRLKERMRAEQREEKKRQREIEHIDNEEVSEEEDLNDADDEEEDETDNEQSEDQLDCEGNEDIPKNTEGRGKLFIDDEASEDEGEEVEVDNNNDYMEQTCAIDDSVLEKSNWTPPSSPCQEESADIKELCDATGDVSFDDAVGLCSGRFVDPSQAPTVIMSNQSQSLTNQSQPLSESKPVDDRQDSKSEGEEAVTEERTQALPDDDKEDIFEKKRKRVVRLFESDEEESEYEEEKDKDNNLEPEEDDEEGDEDKINEDVEYDSEENKITQEKTSFPGFTSKKRIRDEYLEREAELSGSEAASSDEDEAEMDDYENEEGDNDEDIDEDQVLSQLERIRNKQLLDSDRREVRLLQEAFLEDGELHSDQNRKRVFRWKNVDEVEAEESRDDDENVEKDGVDACDEDKDNHEVSALSLRNLPESEDDDSDDQEGLDDSQFFSMATRLMRRMNATEHVLESSVHSQQRTTESIRLVVSKSPVAKTPLQTLQSGSRGSFLSRCQSRLAKLAEATKPKSSINETSTGRSAQRDSARNFVFAAVNDKENDDNDEGSKKRKSEINNEDKQGEERAKRTRLVVDRSIDQSNSNSIFALFGQ